MRNTGLAPREIAVLMHKAAGMGEREIAQEMGISFYTVRVHMRNILRKLEVRNGVAAVALAARDGDLDLDAVRFCRREDLPLAEWEDA